MVKFSDDECFLSLGYRVLGKTGKPLPVANQWQTFKDFFSMLADTFYGSEQNFTLPLPEDPKLTEIKLCAVLRSGVGRSEAVFKHNITLQAGSSFSQTNDSRATRYKVQKL